MVRLVLRPALRCRQRLGVSRRGLATSTSEASPSGPPPPPPPGPPPPPPASGAARLSNKRLISLHGPDAPKFMQGIITNNVRPESRAGLFAAFLTAQGKVLQDVFIYPTLGTQWHRDKLHSDDAGYLVEVDANQATALAAHLKRHKLRAKLQLRLLDEGELDVWSAWKEEDKWTRYTSLSSAGEPEESDGALRPLSILDTRAPGMGRRILLPPASASGSATGKSPLGVLQSLESLEEAPASAYTIRRYLRGVAEGQDEIPHGNILPMNTNIDLMGGIDFKKGCYVGQELTIRTHHTGVVRRRILPVALYDATADAPPEKLEYDASTTISPPTADADIKIEGKRGKPGKWINGVGNIGIAMCRLEMMTDLVVTGEPSTFSPDDRFATLVDHAGQEQKIGVKAFVPDWIRGKIRTPKILKRVE